MSVPVHKTILIVEDDAELRRMFRTALVLEGYIVQEAADGDHALRLLDQQTPDLVVLDLGLPVIDGFSVQADIASRVLTRHLPVVVVTGGAHTDFERLDVECVLRKPVSPDTLVATIKKCLAGGSKRSYQK